jgi:hypothetical protein
MDEGHARDDRGDHAGALESFRAADALMHVPTTGLEVGRQQVALRLLVDARDTLLRVRRLPVVPGEPPSFATAREQAQVMYDGLTARIPALRVSVTGAVAATTTILIDGTRIPASAAGVPFRVNPGHHVVSASGENGGHAEEGVDVAEGVVKEVALTVHAAPADLRGGPALAEARPSPGGNSGSPSPAQSLLRWGGGGLAIVGVGVGAVTGILSFSSTSSAKALCTGGQCPPASWGDLSTASTTATASDIAFAAAGVGVVAFVASFLVTKSSSTQAPAAAVRVIPWFGPTTAGVSATF